MKLFYHPFKQSTSCSWMKVSFSFNNIYILIFLIFSFTSYKVSYSQVTTNGGSGLLLAYPNLADAILDLNSKTINSPVEITLNGNETAPIGGYRITAHGSSSNSITIRGISSTIQAFTPQIAGEINNAIFKIIGGDYITIMGFSLMENPANLISNLAINNMTEWGIALLTISTSDGAQYNTIKNNSISLNRTYANTFGIYSNTNHSENFPLTAINITNVDGANSYNNIIGNAISNINHGITLIGSSNSAFHDRGNNIGGNSLLTGNTITNWGGSAALSSYQYNSGTPYCIFLNHQTHDNTSNNTLISPMLSPSLTLRGIYKRFSASAPIGPFISSINNNIVTINQNTTQDIEVIRSEAFGGSPTFQNGKIEINNNQIINCNVVGPFTAISNNSAPGILNIQSNEIVGTTTLLNSNSNNYGIRNLGAVVDSININSNYLGSESLNYFTFTNAASGLLYGISNEGGVNSCILSISNNNFQGIIHVPQANTIHQYISNLAQTRSQDINQNTFTDLIVNTTGNITFISNNVSVPVPPGYQNINNNRIIGSFSRTPLTPGILTLFTSAAASAGTSIINQTGNNFSNINFNGSVAGWYNYDGASGAQKNISNNTFSDWNITGSFVVNVLNISKGACSISNNTISNIAGAFSISGITIGSGAGSHDVFNNIISGLNSSASVINGISSASPSENIFKNKIFNLTGTNSSSTINGINITSGSTHNIYNNLIGDLETPNANTVNPINGINLSTSIVNSTFKVYYNTVYLFSSSSSTTFGSSCIYHFASNTSTTSRLEMKNNILVNKSIPKGATGRTVVFRRTGINLNNYWSSNILQLPSNNNIFYAGTPASNRLIYYDGTNPDQNLAAFKARVAPRETNSQTEDPNFSSIDGTDAGFLHIVTCGAQPSLAESGAVNIATYTDDYDLEIRQGNPGYTGTGTAPDIGADEFEVTTVAISYAGSPYCISSTTPVNASLTGTGSYSGGAFTSTAGLSINASTGVITPNTSAAGTYTVTYTKTVGACTITATTQVTINALPPAPTISPATPCVGSTPTFTAGNGSIFEFTLNGISQGAPSTNTSYTLSSALTATDQVCVRSYSDCYSETCATILTLPAQPGNIAGNATPCIGADLVYSVPNVAGVTYTWSFPLGWSIVSGQNTNSVTVTIGNTNGNVQVTPSNACGYGSAQTLAVNPINVPAQPSVIAGATTPCEGTTQSYSITNVSGDIYNWTFPAGWVQTAGGTTNSITVTVGATAGDIQATPSNECGNGTPRILAVNPSPIPVLTNNGPYTTCSGTAPGVILNASTSTASTFTWTIGTISGGITGASNGSGPTLNQLLTNPSNVANGSVNYIITPTSVAGLCVGSSTTFQIIVEPAPTVNPISNATYCSGVVVAASSFGSSIAGSTYTWTSSIDIGFGISGSGNIPAYTTVNLTGSPITATISVVSKSPSLCTGPARTFTVTVNPTTIPTITADYCSSPGNIILTANPAGLTYQWYESGIPIGGATTQVITVDHASVYSVTVTNTYGCQGSAVLTVANELVVDGSFTNFIAATPSFITGYTQNQAYYDGTGGSGLYPEGFYAVNTSAWSNYPGAPQGYHNNFHGRDHTNNSTGSRNFMMINGSINTSQIIWQQTVSIQPNTPYYFSAWGMNLNPGSPARLQFEIVTIQNGTEQVGSIADLNIAPKPTDESQVALSNWVRFYSTPFWTSPAGAVSATIRIINLNTDPGGNDFGLDDISFGTLSSAPATVSPTANGGGAVCVGGDLNLNANLTGGIPPFTFSWTGPNSFTSSLQNPVINNVNASHAGTYYLTVEDGYGCTPQVQSVVVVVSPVPVDPTSAQVDRNNFCADDAGNIELTVTGGLGTILSWYTGSCGGTLAGTGTSLIIPSPAVTTTYFARWESICGNSACVSVTVNVNTLPVAPTSITASATTLCAGASLTLTAIGGNGGSGSSPTLNWYTGSCGGTLVGSGTPLNLTAPVSNTTYYARWESSCGNSACASIAITINPLPVAPLTALSDRNNFCEDDPGIITLFVTGGSGSDLNWYTSSCGGTLIGTGTSLSIASPTVTTTYYASWQNGCGSSTCASVTVTVLTKPTAPTSASASPNPVCAGSNVVLTATGGDGGTGLSPELKWYSGSCGGTFVGSGSPLNITAPGINTTYYARWESGCGNSACASVLLNIDPLPAIPTWSAVFPINYCVPTTGVVFSVNPIPGALSYVWSYSAANAVINAPSNTNSITMDFSAVGALTIGTLSVYAVNACGNGTPVSRVVRAYPEALVNAGPDATICAGQNVSLNGTASVGSTTPSVTWTSSGDGSFLPDANTLNASYTPGSTDITNGTVTLTLTTPKPSAPCPGPVTDDMVITILPAPIPVITGSNSACVGATGNIYSTAAGISNYSWVVSASGTITSGGGINDNTVTVTWSSIGPQTVSVNYTAANGCSAITPTVFNVLVNPLPNAVISYSGGPYCPVGTVNVTQSGQGGGTYSAAPAGLSINPGSGQINLAASTSGTYTVTYSFTNGTCSNTTSTNVVVKASPDLYVVTGGGSYCAGGAGVPVGLSGSQLGVSYQLQIGGVNTGLPVAGTGAAISFGNQTAAGTYTVIATLASTSCTATMTGSALVNILPLPLTSTIYHF